MNARLLPTVLAAAVLFTAAGAVGCGEKDEPETTGSTSTAATTASTTTEVTSTTVIPSGPLTAAEYAAAADELCSSATAEQEDLRRKRGGRQITLRDRARQLVLLAPVRVEFAEQLGELEPPAQERKQARALVASAVRRGEASTEAGRLFQEQGSHEEIAAAAAAEHDERVRIVEIAGGLGMAECAEVLPPKQVAEVQASVEQGLGDPDPAARCAVIGQRYLEELYGGGITKCVAAGNGGFDVTDLEVSAITGMDRIFAEARAEVAGGGETREYRVRLTYEDGTYKIDKLD